MNSQISTIPVLFFGHIGLPRVKEWVHSSFKDEGDTLQRNKLSGLLISSVCVEVVISRSLDDYVHLYSKYKVLIFTSLKDFNNFCSFDKYVCHLENTQVIVVTQTLKVLYEKGIYAVDVVYDKEQKFIVKKRTLKSAYYAFYDTVNESSYIYKVSDFGKPLPKINQYLREVVHRVKQGSFLTPFMTFIYRLPYSTHQKPIKNLFINWLFYSGKEAHIYKALDFMEKHNPVFKLSPRVVSALKNALTLPNIGQYSKAFEYLRENPNTPYKELVAMFKIDIYEINYMVAVTNSEVVMLTNQEGKELLFSRYFGKLNNIDSCEKINEVKE